MNSQQAPDSLSPEKLQLFTAALAGLPAAEVRKAKELYIRNAIAEYRAVREQMRSIGCVMVLFMLVPLFWPFLYAMRRSTDAGLRLQQQRIENALLVWREDLEGIDFDF